MAISKTQPMRSAEINLIDTVNDNITAINNLSSDVADEVAARENADTTLDNKIDIEIDNRTNADRLLDNKIDLEIDNRTNADTLLDGKIDTEITQRANADTEIMNIIGTGFSSSNTISTNVGEIKDSIGTGFSSANTIASNIQALQGFDNRFRIGTTQAYTIAASGTQVVSVDFNTPYESTDEVMVLINPIGANETFTDLKCVLDSAGYVGFSATIENSDTVNSYTVALGFVAVKVN